MAYLYKMKMQMLVRLSYRFEVFAGIISKVILVAANVFLWKCVYTGEASLDGLSEKDMITYSILSVCLSVVFFCGVQDTMANHMRSGVIAMMLLKPYSLLGSYLAEDLGTIIVRFFNEFLPILLAGILLFGITGPVSPESFLLVLASSLLAFLILWFLSALIGMLTFVTMELGFMGILKDTIVAILSGSMIPIWFFPAPVEQLLMKTPFPYTYQTPLGLYIGKISIPEGLAQMQIQLFWALILCAVTLLSWKRLQNHVMVQGG